MSTGIPGVEPVHGFGLTGAGADAPLLPDLTGDVRGVTALTAKV